MGKKKVVKKKKLSANQQKEHALALVGLAVQSIQTSRADLQARLGYAYGGDRDVYKALGYKESLDFTDYDTRYQRQDIAKRVIDLPVDATWRKKPEIIDEEGSDPSDFEQAWMDLVRDKKVYHYLTRIDKIARIGCYGILLVGFDDGKDLSKELASAKNITYMRPFKETNVPIHQWEVDKNNERFGLPKFYNCTFSNAERTGTATNIVHYSRVVHVAEGLQEDNVYGTPTLKAIFNRLMNMELLSGGSAEMFWRGALPGMVFEADAEADQGTLDNDDMSDEIENFMHNLQRYLRLQGVKAKQLQVQYADPKSHAEFQFSLIAAVSNIPLRILIGSERGELASSQDERAWNNTVDARRTDHAEPMILRPFIDLNIKAGVLPEPKSGQYTVKWPDLQLPSEKEVADVAKLKSEILEKYLNTPGADVIIPIESFLKDFLHYSKEEVEQLMDNIDLEARKESEEERAQAAAEAGSDTENNS